MCQDRWCGFLYNVRTKFVSFSSFRSFRSRCSLHFTSHHFIPLASFSPFSRRFGPCACAMLRLQSLPLRSYLSLCSNYALFKLRFVQTTLVPPPRCFGSTRFVFTLSRVAPVLAPAAPLPPLRSYLSRYRTGMIKNMSNIGEMTERSGEWSRRRNE